MTLTETIAELRQPDLDELERVARAAQALAERNTWSPTFRIVAKDALALIARLRTAEAQRQADKARIAELEAGLKPFAEVFVNDVGADEIDADLYRPTKHNHAKRITIEHLCTAARLLAPRRDET